MRDEKDRARTKLGDKSSVVNVKALESDTAELRIEAGANSLSPTLRSSSASIPSTEAQTETQATYDQPPFTEATILAFGWLPKLSDLPITRVELSMRKLVKAAIAKALRLYLA